MTDYINNIIKNEIKDLECILEKYIDKTYSTGTKGIIRGNKFNNIVKNYLLNLNLNKDKFEICFEKKNNKVIIGMNQLDL